MHARNPEAVQLRHADLREGIGLVLPYAVGTHDKLSGRAGQPPRVHRGPVTAAVLVVIQIQVGHAVRDVPGAFALVVDKLMVKGALGVHGERKGIAAQCVYGLIH